MEVHYDDGVDEFCSRQRVYIQHMLVSMFIRDTLAARSRYLTALPLEEVPEVT